MRIPVVAFLIAFLLTGIMLAASAPTGLDLIFKKVESGKRFHPFWPPVSGHQILGTVVVAKNPGKPQAFFQTIDSPSYRNPGYKGEFIVGTLVLDAPDLTSEQQISGAAAFSQLESIGKAMVSASQSKSLDGNSGASTVNCQTAGQNSTSATPGDKPASNTSSAASISPGGAKSDGTADKISDAKTTQKKGVESTSGGTTPGGSSSQNVTGIDFCRFTNATSKVTGLKIIYYDLPTLNDINANHALTPSAEQLIDKGTKGWIIHRALIVDSIEYSLTSNGSIDAGFFAKLVAWLPTVAVTYKNENTVTLKTTSPLTIGYKLWQRGSGVEGRDMLSPENLPNLGIGSEAIDALLFPNKK